MQIILFAIALSSAFAAAPRPSDIVNLKDVDPTIQVDMIYHGANNFTGKPVDGYTENVCLLAKSAAEALKKAQARLQEEGKKSGKLLSLAMTDCYRPQRAVKAFVAWAKLPDDPEAKRKYFPDLTKPQLISDNYISPVSGHSRAASVDLMIIEKVGSSEPRQSSSGFSFQAQGR
jgi:D-alanyl-D-alanine dipeptidase